jgi:hypothetical protein
MSLLGYWPDERNCLDCIKPEAENPADAVFLAVHQPMTLQRLSFATKQKELRTDQQLLAELLKDDPSGPVIMPILGESGIGKSHLVRWLDVQLGRREDRAKRHVIRIPKSSSLKSVLHRILDGLQGPRYEEIRSQLQAARDQLDAISARQRVRAEILVAIERRHLAAKERKSQVVTHGGSLTREEELWIGHGDERSLRALLSDPATERFFLEGTTQRPGIVSEFASHLTTDRHVTRPQFETKDFEVPPSLAALKDSRVVSFVGLVEVVIAIDHGDQVIVLWRVGEGDGDGLSVQPRAAAGRVHDLQRLAERCAVRRGINRDLERGDGSADHEIFQLEVGAIGIKAGHRDIRLHGCGEGPRHRAVIVIAGNAVESRIARRDGDRRAAPLVGRGRVGQ